MSNLNQLIDTYPRLLRGSGPQIPGYVGAGWHPIVMRLMASIDKMLSDELAAGFRVVQIKEKFGGLRFYWQVSKVTGEEDEDDWLPEAEEDEHRAELAHRISLLTQEAEDKCEKRCETCGEPGELRPGGWLRTLCDRHAKGRK